MSLVFVSLFSVLKGSLGITSIGFSTISSSGNGWVFSFINSNILSNLSWIWFDKSDFLSKSLLLNLNCLSKFILSSTVKPGVGSVVSYITLLLLSSAFSIAASKSVLLIVIAVCR